MQGKLRSVLEKIENGLINVCVLFLIIIIAIIMFQIITRRLGVATSGTEELARYCYVLFVFILWPVAAVRGQDLRITVLFDILSGRTRRIIMGIFHMVMAVYGSMFCYSMYVNMGNAFKGNLRASTNRWIQMGWLYAVIVLAFLLLLAANLVRAYLLFSGQETVLTQEEQNSMEMEAETEKIQKELENVERGRNV